MSYAGACLIIIVALVGVVVFTVAFFWVEWGKRK